MAIVLFVVAALVVDLGLARDTRSQSQNAADASALAGAQALNATSSTPDLVAAVAAAKSCAAVNFGVSSADWSTCTDPGHKFVPAGSTPCISFADQTGTASSTSVSRVRVVIPSRTVKTGLGSAAGVSSIPVSAAAEADNLAVAAALPCGLCVLESSEVTGNPALRVAGLDSMVMVKNLRLTGNGTIALNYTQADNVPATVPSVSLSR